MNVWLGLVLYLLPPSAILAREIWIVKHSTDPRIRFRRNAVLVFLFWPLFFWPLPLLLFAICLVWRELW